MKLLIYTIQLLFSILFLGAAGVLNNEELAIVNSTFKKTEVCSLPGIQEELRKSTESTSTLDSESYTLESLEGDLFENLRASIQMSFGKRDCSSGESAASCMGCKTTRTFQNFKGLLVTLLLGLTYFYLSFHICLCSYLLKLCCILSFFAARKKIEIPSQTKVSSSYDCITFSVPLRGARLT